MTKELEALDIIEFELWDNDLHYQKYSKELNTIRQALQRLESIDNADSSEALDYLERIRDVLQIDKCIDIEWVFKHEYNTIKEALIQAERDKIIADFVRKHYKLNNDINKNYLELKKPITQEEHIKFKENL